MAEPFLLGVLGGMGPLAAVDFQQRLLEATPANSDQQQIPTVVWNVPQIADRQQALAGLGPSPLPQMREGIARLSQAGATHIVIVCNTAHHWYDELAAASEVPILHIVEATLNTTLRDTPALTRVGLIATRGTLNAGWFQRAFAAQGIETVAPTDEELEALFVPGCYAVKRGDLSAGGELLARQAHALVSRGAERLILACTEVPIALRAVDSGYLDMAVDPTKALAERCAKIWMVHRQY